MNDLLESRIQAMLDSTISEEEFHHLEDELQANPEARLIYYQYVALHQGLEYRLARAGSLSGVKGLAQARLHAERSRSRRFAILTAAALIAICLVIMQLFFIERTHTSERVDIASSPGSVYTLTDTNGELMTSPLLEPDSRLVLTQGSVELSFSSGVRAVVKGPADLTLHDHGKLYIDNGSGWFHVPAGAEGFTVVTRELDIVDLGTEFGVVSDPEKEDEVHVFEGKVHVRALHGVKKEITLTKSQSVSVKPYGRFTARSSELSGFLKKLPDTLPHQHWSFEDLNHLLATNTITGAQGMDVQLHSRPAHTSDLFTHGKYGRALSLDGIGSYLATDWHGILGDAPRTVAFWLKMPNRRSVENFPTFHNHHILAWGTQQEGINSTLNSKFTIHFDHTLNRYPMFNVSFGGFWYYAPETEFDDDRWHHLAITYNGKSDAHGYPVTRLFVDGKERALKPAWHKPVHTHEDGQVIIRTQPKTPFVIGAKLSAKQDAAIIEGFYTQAAIDELYIIEGVISEASILSLMNNNQLRHE